MTSAPAGPADPSARPTSAVDHCPACSTCSLLVLFCLSCPFDPAFVAVLRRRLLEFLNELAHEVVIVLRVFGSTLAPIGNAGARSSIPEIFDSLSFNQHPGETLLPNCIPLSPAIFGSAKSPPC
jgi:hypothetical protein